MSAIGKKTKLNYIVREITTNKRGREVTSFKTVKQFKAVLSAVKHYGSGSKDTNLAGQITVTYDFELFVNKRDARSFNEKDLIEEPSTGYRYEIQQILTTDNNRSNVWVAQLLRMR